MKIINWNKYNRFWIIVEKHSGGVAFGLGVVIWNSFGKHLIVALVPVPKRLQAAVQADHFFYFRF